MKRVKIQCNGRQQTLADGATLAQLLDELGLPADSVVAEINKQIIDRDQYATLKLSSGDQVELIRFVGGG
ncbi:MAG TPA: sulfur carrier protein ThiS [Desulfobulbaceae bacterium]|nr:sulfur carrier protein ThiS [Desulfobulbaceae bacterium]